MKIEKISLDKLVNHPQNPNVMDSQSLAKLAQHIERHSHYEPLVIRPHPKKPGYYQLINGHHRKQVLRNLGHLQANCVVWNVSDEETMMLLATMNRLTGRDNPKARAQLLANLTDKYHNKELLKNLPETKQQLQKMLSLIKPCQMIAPDLLAQMPLALTFFVTEHQKKIIENSLNHLRSQARGDDPENKMTPGDLLVIMAHNYLETK